MFRLTMWAKYTDILTVLFMIGHQLSFELDSASWLTLTRDYFMLALSVMLPNHGHLYQIRAPPVVIRAVNHKLL